MFNAAHREEEEETRDVCMSLKRWGAENMKADLNSNIDGDSLSVA